MTLQDIVKKVQEVSVDRNINSQDAVDDVTDEVFPTLSLNDLLKIIEDAGLSNYEPDPNYLPDDSLRTRMETIIWERVGELVE